MNQLVGELIDDEDILDQINELEPLEAKKKKFDHFTKWTNSDFVKRFRLPKVAVQCLLNNIADFYKLYDMVFITLRYFVTGSFLQVMGDFAGVDKATASRIVYKVSRAIAGLHSRFIKMPETEDELKYNCREFYDINKFPKCIGTLDCSHVKIAPPGDEEPEIY
ncbi:hypothetical protein Zmor_011391 [Zophobas morio]|uniref:Nuclease HARBI1 n=1 Tax=Zophobas morio TaxID=2755281 RepID=A0AA38ILW6_9CUCU|nr:hypothetical protein Zmor_011391 [Zophobas morio]